MSFFQSQNDYSNYLNNISTQAQSMSNTYLSSYADMLNQPESSALLYQNNQIESKQLNSEGLDDLLFSAPLFNDTLKPLMARGKTAIDYLNTALDKAKGTKTNVEDLIRRAQKIKDRNIVKDSTNQEISNQAFDPTELEELPESLSFPTTDLALQAKKEFIISNSNNDPKVLTKVVNGTDAEVEDLYKTTLENTTTGAKNVSPMEGIRSGEMAVMRPEETGSAFDALTSGESTVSKLLGSPEGQRITDAINQFRLRNVDMRANEIQNRAYQPNELMPETEMQNPLFNANELDDLSAVPKEIGTATQAVSEAIPKEAGMLDNILPNIRSVFQTQKESFLGKLNQMGSQAKESVQDLGNIKKSFVGDILDKTEELKNASMSRLLTPDEQSVISKGRDIVQNFGSASANELEDAYTTATKFGDTLSSTIPRFQKTKSVFGDAYNFMGGERMVPVLPDPRQLLTGGGDIMASAKQGAESAITSASQGAQDIASTARQGVESAMETARQGIDSAMTTGEGILSSAREGAQSAMSSAQGLVSSAKEGIQGAMETGQGMANSALETFESAKNNLVSKVQSLTDSIPKLPSSVTALTDESSGDELFGAIKDIGGTLLKEETTGGALLDTLGEVGQIGLAGYSIYKGISDFIQGKNLAQQPQAAQQQYEPPTEQSTVNFSRQAGVY